MNMTISLQLTFLGVILIAGFFVIWRQITTLAENVRILRKDVDGVKGQLAIAAANAATAAATAAAAAKASPMDNPMFANAMMMQAMNGIFDDDDEDDDEENDEEDQEDQEDQYQEEGIDDIDELAEFELPPKSSVRISELPDDIVSTTDTMSEIGGNPLSKNKLNKMSVDEIRDLLASHNQSTEGSKKVMIQRILDSKSFSSA